MRGDADRQALVFSALTPDQLVLADHPIRAIKPIVGRALQAISPDLPARSAYLRWMLVAILLAAIVLYRPEGLIKERKVVSAFLPKHEARQA